MEKVFTNKELEDLRKTIEYCKRLSKRIYLLYGNYGVGKTEFVKQYIGQQATSPTFNYLNIYPYEGKEVWHYDLYRSKKEDLEDLGIIDAFDQGYLVFIEWPEIIGEKIINLYREDIVKVLLENNSIKLIY